MKNLKIVLTVLSISLMLSLFSCSDDDTGTPVGCLNMKFYSLRIPNQNVSNNVDFVSNSSASINSTSVNVETTSSFQRLLNANRAAFDRTSSDYAFINNWNTSPGSELISTSGLSGFNTPVNLSPTTSRFDGIVFYNGIFYALEKDTSGAVYVVQVNLSGTTTRLTSVDISSSISLSANLDVAANRCYSTSNETGKLYFLGENLVEIDASTGTLLNTYTLPAIPSFTYVDIVKNHTPSTNGLFVAKIDGNFNGIVHWELDSTSSTVLEIPLIDSLDLNPETTDLTYNECGDRLLAMSNYTGGGLSKFYDIAVGDDADVVPNQGNLIGTRTFNEFFVGVVVF